MEQLYPIKFHFYKKSNLLAKSIKHFAGSKYSHVSIFAYGTVREFIGGRLFGENGYQFSPNKETRHQGRHKADEIHTITVKVDRVTLFKVHAFCVDVSAKNYDYFGAVSFAFKFLTNRAGSYYCSEFARRILEIITDEEIQMTRTSPAAIYDLVNHYHAGLVHYVKTPEGCKC